MCVCVNMTTTREEEEANDLEEEEEKDEKDEKEKKQQQREEEEEEEEFLRLLEKRLPQSQSHVLEHAKKMKMSEETRAKMCAQMENLGDELEYFCDAFHRAMVSSKKTTATLEKSKKEKKEEERESTTSTSTSNTDDDGNGVGFEKKKRKTRIEPIVPDVVAAEASEEEKRAWREEGYALIRSGKVGAIVMAGGQGLSLIHI